MSREIDWLIVTAANGAQARGYRAQLAARGADGRLGGVKRWLVVPDVGDRRIGSGGSTFVVLQELARRLRKKPPSSLGPAAFQDQRVLIIHSGGDSRRLPAYAAEGKVFVPVPGTLDSGHSATLFDLILADLATLVHPGRVLIATGDVLLGVAEHGVDLSGPGLVGVAFPGTPSVASRHGVYVCDTKGRVTDFLQKPDIATARRRKALDGSGRLLIDTGILSLDASAAGRWTRASAALVEQFHTGRGGPIDLYSDILPALSRRASARSAFARLRIPLRVATIPRCDFLHIGSTRELLAISTTMGSARHRAVTLNSVVAAPLAQHPTSLVESSRISHRTRLGNHGMLVGFPGGFPLRLDDHLGMVFLPIGRSEWAAVAFGVNDDFKTPLGRGGTICNAGISKRLLHAQPSLLEVTAWDLPCWVVGSLRETCRAARETIADPSKPLFDPGARASTADLMPRVNIQRLLDHRRALQSESDVASIKSQLRAGIVPPGRLILTSPRPQRASLARLVASRARSEGDPFARARLHHLAAILNPARAAAHEAMSFLAIAEGVAADTTQAPSARAAISRAQLIIVTSPVRIDLCGGWSDTPPICHELGGTVVNAAITLGGRHPIRVSAKLIHERVVRLRSDDLGKTATLSTTRAALAFQDPHDWTALPKAALTLAGITPRRGSLARRLRDFGGGIELTMSAAVPKGSGLGTSSILGAAVLACLDRVCGRRESTRSLIKRTSILEQMMSTAGGWQDQAGGITPGIKVLRTRPGADQVPRISPLHIPQRAMQDLRDRSILYCTGQRRLARDILQGVVRRYLSGEPAAIRIIHDLKSAAEEMARDLARGDIDAFARGVRLNWELKKAIDPGATNRRIEQILAPVDRLLSGYELAGAGGGGFIFMVARSAKDIPAIREMLSSRRATDAALCDFDIDHQGLSISEAR